MESGSRAFWCCARRSISSGDGALTCVIFEINGRIEVAQKMAGHSNAKTTSLYDRRNDDISVGEVERIGI